MGKINDHLRKTFLAGIFAGVPIVVTVWIVIFVEEKTRSLFNFNIRFIGIAVAIAGIYVAGVVATSLLGKQLLHVVDHILSKLPVFGQIYSSWKQVALTPGAGGIFSHVVLVPDETGTMLMLGFTTGRGIEGAETL